MEVAAQTRRTVNGQSKARVGCDAYRLVLTESAAEAGEPIRRREWRMAEAREPMGISERGWHLLPIVLCASS